MNTNPYTPTRIQHAPSPRHRLRFWTVAAIYLYPLIVLTSLYLTWGIVTMQLGRPPVPYREYPDGFVIMVSSWVTAILHLLAPIAVPAGVAVSVLFPFARPNPNSASIFSRIASLVTYTAIGATAFIVLSRDPYRVSDWFWD